MQLIRILLNQVCQHRCKTTSLVSYIRYSYRPPFTLLHNLWCLQIVFKVNRNIFHPGDSLLDPEYLVMQTDYLLVILPLVHKAGGICHESYLVHVAANLFQLPGHAKVVSGRSFAGVVVVNQ